jgi:putative SOS response-associated peptidase YedK
MCGRMVVSVPDLSLLVPSFHVVRVAPPIAAWQPRFNLAPSQLAPAITNESERRLGLFRFGLVPSWAKSTQIGSKLINARVETVATKPAFRHALALRRCIVPVTGYYEWQRVAGAKRPLFIHDAQGAPILLAGVWERWHSPQGDIIESFAILTRASEGFLRDIHARMPLEVPQAQVERWLDPAEQSPSALAPILNAGPEVAHLAAYEVSALVNSPKNDAPECMAESSTLPDAQRGQLDLFERTPVARPRHARAG